jgi:YjeF-related protein N-terminus
VIRPRPAGSVAPIGVGASGLGAAELFIDAILGCSQRGNAHGDAAALVAATADSAVLSLDVPAGLELERGMVGEPTVRAAATLTQAPPKDALRGRAARPLVDELYWPTSRSQRPSTTVSALTTSRRSPAPRSFSSYDRTRPSPTTATGYADDRGDCRDPRQSPHSRPTSGPSPTRPPVREGITWHHLWWRPMSAPTTAAIRAPDLRDAFEPATDA